MLLRRGACPFECCIYRDWTARAPIDVLAAPEVGSDILWKIDPNEGFRAATGHVEVTGLTQVVVMREAEGFTPGDTLFVLDYAGEGFFNVWHAGTVSQPMQFWTDEEWTLSSRAAGYSLGEYSAEWWIEVTGPTGATGWVQGATAAFDGAGRDCGG